MNKVNISPAIPRPSHAAKLEALHTFDVEMVKALIIELLAHAQRLNGMLPADGSEHATGAMTFDAAVTMLSTLAVSGALTVSGSKIDATGGPVVLKSYTVAGVPSAATFARGLIYVSNETGGATVAFSDGTNWRRVQDRAVIA